MSQKLAAILAKLRQALEISYGERLVQVMLFGSRARGDAADDSDIDVLVILKGQVNSGDEIGRVGETTAALSLEYDVVISCVFMPEERYQREQSPFLLNVRREGVPV